MSILTYLGRIALFVASVTATRAHAAIIGPSWDWQPITKLAAEQASARAWLPILWRRG
jgi:hypothetical protein